MTSDGDRAPAPVFPELFNLADYFLFDRVREGKGDKVASRFGDRSWTYAQVAARSRALARWCSPSTTRRARSALGKPKRSRSSGASANGALPKQTKNVPKPTSRP